MDWTLLAKTPAALKGPADLLGLCQGLESKVTAIGDSYLDSAILELELAFFSDNEKTHLLRSARSKLTQAIAIERGCPIRLSLSYVALSFVHDLLGDRTSYTATMTQFIQMDMKPPAKRRNRGRAADFALKWVVPGAHTIMSIPGFEMSVEQYLQKPYDTACTIQSHCEKVLRTERPSDG